MKKVDILAELKRLDPKLKAAQIRRLSTLTVKTLREVLRQQRVWAGVSRDTRVKKDGASPFWKYRDQMDTPLLPWEITVGPGLDMEGDIDPDPDYFAEEEYSYEDFDTDWGGYEYEDTGYPDEDA